MPFYPTEHSVGVAHLLTNTHLRWWELGERVPSPGLLCWAQLGIGVRGRRRKRLHYKKRQDRNPWITKIREPVFRIPKKLGIGKDGARSLLISPSRPCPESSESCCRLIMGIFGLVDDYLSCVNNDTHTGPPTRTEIDAGLLYAAPP